MHNTTKPTWSGRVNKTIVADRPSGATSEGHRVLWMWWDEGVLRNARYMLVILCKMNIDSEKLYPVYSSKDHLDEVVHLYSRMWKTHIMEIYDLSRGRMAQLAERRAWNVPK